MAQVQGKAGEGYIRLVLLEGDHRGDAGAGEAMLHKGAAEHPEGAGIALHGVFRQAVAAHVRQEQGYGFIIVFEHFYSSFHLLLTTRRSEKRDSW